MKKTLSIVMFVLLVFLAVACSPEHQHDYKLVPEKSIEATCTANGYNYMVCSCGAIQSIPTAALGHDFVEDMDQHVDSTCRTKGRKVSYCSRENCSEVKEETLPLDVNNHPFYEAVYSGASTTPSGYVGVYASLGTAKDVTYPTCAAEGVGTFSACTACGKTGDFKVVIPNDAYVLYAIVNSTTDFLSSKRLSHVKLNSEGNSIEAIDDDDIKSDAWVVTKDSTAFVTGTQNAICPTCGKEITDDNGNSDKKLTGKPVACKNEEVCGYYVYSDKPANPTSDWNVYYINISGNPTMTPDEYEVEAYKSTYTKEGVNKTTEKLAFSSSSWTANGETAASPRGLTLTLDGTEYYFSIITAEGKDKGKLSLTIDAGTAVVVDKVVEHTHSFDLMDGMAAVQEDAHYVECACGLKYYAQNHGNGCKVCGKDSDWVLVTIGKNNGSGNLDSSVKEEFYAPKEAITIPKTGTYYFLKGGSLSYNATTLVKAPDSGSVDTTGTKFTPGTEGMTVLLTVAN